MKKLSLNQMIQCKKLGKAFEIISTQKKWNNEDFVKEWLKSDLATPYILDDCATTCQSATYLSNDILAAINLPESDTSMNTPALYWIGYVLMAWIYLNHIEPTTILNSYNIKEIILDYPVLHTLSLQATIDEFSKDYKLVA